MQLDKIKWNASIARDNIWEKANHYIKNYLPVPTEDTLYQNTDWYEFECFQYQRFNQTDGRAGHLAGQVIMWMINFTHICGKKGREQDCDPLHCIVGHYKGQS